MAARQAKKRPGRTRSESNPGQLSFFDPAGELPALRREQRELLAQQSHQAEHRRFLAEAVERAADRAGRAAAELDQVQRDASRVQQAQLDEQFEVSIVVGETRRDFHDRREAGTALLAELQSRVPSLVRLQTVTGLGTIAGLELCVVVAGKAGAELLLGPAIGDPDSTLYPGADIRIAAFESMNWPDGFFDLAISNVPFGAYGRDEWFALNEDTDPTGLVRRFEGLIKGIPRFLAQKAEELDKSRADLPRLDRLIAAPGFGKQGQLDEARARMLRLEEAGQNDMHPGQRVGEIGVAFVGHQHR